MATAQSSLEDQLADLGFLPVPSRGKHKIVRHPTAGSFPIPSTVGRGRSAANTLAIAKRKIRQAHSIASLFLDYLCDLYEVPRDGKKLLQLNVSDEIRSFIEREPGGERINAGSLMAMARQHPRVVIRAKPKGAHYSIWELRGKDYVEVEENHEEEGESPVSSVAPVTHLPTPEPQSEPQPGAPVGDLVGALTEAVGVLQRHNDVQSKIDLIVTSLKAQHKQLGDLISLLQE